MRLMLIKTNIRLIFRFDEDFFSIESFKLFAPAKNSIVESAGAFLEFQPDFAVYGEIKP